ncbi:Carboxylic ester hydrolase [Mycena kentingensis (nom. inval.)]|nr:Carboxylic ester hydrolase [Mycena kentingensis (nom. inval.)]
MRLRAAAPLLLSLTAAAAPLSTVKLDYGTFTGITNATAGYISFLGVRYADPPTGDLRWRAPVSPPSKNLGSVNATSLGYACIATTQTNSGATTSEDCLFGNVYVPIAATAGSKLPVLVYFHGGGFEGGRTSDAPANHIMPASKEPFVYVAFEYRLGQFGFLAGEAVREQGLLNAGLWDQRAALEWVQRYIGSFGGDKTRVTMWGQSAGAASVMYQLIAEGGANKKNLFQQVIADSPPMISLHPVDASDPYLSNLFAQFTRLAGCSSGTSTQIMACLRAASTAKLATAGANVLINRTSALYPIGPILDGDFVRERPVDAFTKGNFVHVPGIFGSNTDEGLRWSAMLDDPAANTDNPSATQTTVYNFIAGQYVDFTRAAFDKAVKDFYPLADYSGSFRLQGSQMYGEMRYICSAVLLGGVFQRAGLKAWQYHWDNPTLGSGHGAELDAFFQDDSGYDAASKSIVAAMREYWTTYITGGSPVSASTKVAWKLTTDDGSARILFRPGKLAMETVSPALEKRCAYWQSIAATELGI